MHNFFRYPYYRGNTHTSTNIQPTIPKPPPSPVFPPKPPQKHPIPPPKPPQKNSQKNKFDFDCFKHDTCKSLKEVECFLNNFSDFLRYAKLVKLLKGNNHCKK